MISMASFGGLRPSQPAHLQWDGCANQHDGRALSQRVAEIVAEREKIHGQATAAAIERVALTKTWVLDKLIENVDRAHRSRWSPRARGEGWGPIIRLIGLQGALVVDALLLGLFVPRARRLKLQFNTIKNKYL